MGDSKRMKEKVYFWEEIKKYKNIEDTLKIVNLESILKNL